jgi:aminoglycoside phosphotransferase (APT) family kinase protein
MSATAVPDSAPIDGLPDLVARSLGPKVSVQSVTRETSPFVTLFPAEILTLGLSDGRTLRLFLKHLGAEEADHPDKQRRDRELLVYQQLFRNEADLPVPFYFGSRAGGGASARYDLYLEHIDDWALKYHALEHWFTAAARLADMHAHFAVRAEELRACDFLLQLNQAYFAAWADRAQTAVGEQSGVLGDRLGIIRARYGLACDLLASQPVTLVHNDLACKNVIADRSCTPARICIVDWEMAGAGCGLLDLVHLKYGLAPADDARMIAAYRQTLGRSGLLPDSDREFARLLAACELHKTLYRLAHSPAWKLPLESIEQWVAESEAFLQHVLEP